MSHLYLNHLGIVCALGCDHATIMQRLLVQASSGVAATDTFSPGVHLPLGRVMDVLAEADHLPVRQRSRNNRLALAALASIHDAVAAAVDRFGGQRVGVVIGTSTSGIAEGEAAIRSHSQTGVLPPQFHYGQQEMGSVASVLASAIGATGPAYVHSSACASSAKAMASAARLIRMGLCDAVLTGGVDTLCAFTVAGFSALESVSGQRCNPLSANRNGINIGEGAALFLMTREPATVGLRGWGETSDAYHISAPDPEGKGAAAAIQQALRRAGLAAQGMDYVNLHGTATRQNDAMESHVIHALFGPDVAVSSTKPFTGHTLGAAGAIEAGLCWLAMQDNNPGGILPPHLWDGERDPALPALNACEPGATLGRPIRRALSTSFAFGGANAALILGRE